MGSRHGAPGIGDLPDDALVGIFEHLTRAERHARLAFVCTRWARLVCSPALLRRVEFKPHYWQSREQNLARLQSWCHQIARWGTNGVEELIVRVLLPDADAVSTSVAEQLASAVAAAASGCQLTRLQLSCTLPLLEACMVPELHTLKSLHLKDVHQNPDDDRAGGAQPAAADLPSLAFLTRLESVELGALAIRRMASNRAPLPPALTSVNLDMRDLSMDLDDERNVECVAFVMKTQVLVLPHLRRFAYHYLQLLKPNNPLEALTCVAGTLKELKVHGNDLPTCLSALTGLEALEVESGVWIGSKVADRLPDALPHLQRLTRLALGSLSCMPATITSLPHLAELRLSSIEGPLPRGSWLSSLRSLELVTCAVGAAWQDMRQLERLRLKLFCEEEDEESFTHSLRWAAKHQSLRHLQLVIHETLPLRARKALEGVRRRRPHLHIEFSDFFSRP